VQQRTGFSNQIMQRHIANLNFLQKLLLLITSQSQILELLSAIRRNGNWKLCLFQNSHCAKHEKGKL